MHLRDSVHDLLGLLMAVVYLALATNLMLVIACLPLVLILVTTDPSYSWPLLLATVPLCVPALSAASTVFAAFSADTSVAVVRTFWRGWRASFLRAGAVGALATVLCLVCAVDIVWAWGQQIGAFAIPILVMLIVLAVSIMLTALVALGSVPRARMRDLLRVAAYVTVRRWYFTIASLIVLALLWELFTSRPALALGLAAAPMLYVVWAGAHYALRPAIEPRPGAPARPGA